MNAPDNNDYRLSFTELMNLIPLPPLINGSGEERFMSTRPAFNPGQGFAYGGMVFAQSVWAASFSVGKDMVVHNVHGFFPLPGLVDRPYVYSISHLSEGRSYCTRQVQVQQPTSPTKPRPTSSTTSGKQITTFDIEDVKGELGKVCFSSMISFKRDEEYVMGHQTEDGVRERYKNVIEGRRPDSWAFVPRVDAAWADRAISRYPSSNDFPGLSIQRVDMAHFNANLSPAAYRQLNYYTPLGHIPLSKPNLHACAHLYASDRNSLYLIPRALDTSEDISQMGSLSHSVIFHISSKDLIIKEGEWWIHEAWSPRSGHGRGVHESRMWKLGEDGEEGRDVHVASSWQDGVVRYSKTRSKQKMRLLWFEGMRKMGLIGEDVCLEEGLSAIEGGERIGKEKL